MKRLSNKKGLFRTIKVLLLTALFLVPFGNVYADDIDGTGGDDVLIGTGGDDTIDGFGGSDWIMGQGGSDTIDGGSGIDFIDGGAGDDVIEGGDGNDFLMGNNGNDEIHGGDGDDLFFAGNGDDVVYGDAGDDVVNGYSGDDVIYGGDGNDDLGGGFGNDEIHGGEGDDEINGYLDDDVLDGGAGDDLILGHDGDDLITTSEGQDNIDAGNGNDTIMITGVNGNGAGNETYVTGGTGVNLFAFEADTSGNLILESQNDGSNNAAEDTLDFSLFGQSVAIDLSLTGVQQEVASWGTSSLWLTLNGFFTHLIGSSEDDTLIGNDLENTIQGLGGSDSIDGGGAVDEIYGGDTSDAGDSYDTSDGYDIDLTSDDPNNHEDVWHSIEYPRPEEPEVDSKLPNNMIVIDVESGEQVQLPCGTECVKVRLKDDDSNADGSYAVLCNMCDHYVTLEEETEETLRIKEKVDIKEFKDPKTFEDGRYGAFIDFKEKDPKMIMGVTVHIFDSAENKLDRVPPEGSMRVGYPVKPEEMARKDDFHFHHHHPEVVKDWDKIESRIIAEDYKDYEEHYITYTNLPGTFIHLVDEEHNN